MASKYPPRGPDWIVPFGKYKDHPLWEVIDLDPRYVQQWLIEECDVELDNEAFALLSQRRW